MTVALKKIFISTHQKKARALVEREISILKLFNHDNVTKTNQVCINIFSLNLDYQDL